MMTIKTSIDVEYITIYKDDKNFYHRVCKYKDNEFQVRKNQKVFQLNLLMNY